MKRFSHLFALALGCAAGASAAQNAPVPKDFASGLAVSTVPGLPVQQFTVPEQVYQGVMRADLGDLRVFNGGGIVVPHALCTAPETTPETVHEQPLPVFPLRLARPPPLGQSQNGARVNVQTPGGTSVQIVEAPAGGAGKALTPVAPAPADGFVVDAREAPGPLRTLRLAWTTSDGASEAHVRVEASDDLNQWRTIVDAATLLHVAADGQALDRSHIELPGSHYRYLRLVRNAGPAVGISAVTADVVQAGTVAAPRWFAAMPAADADSEGLLFDAGRLAPVQAARVELPMPNMSIRAALDSRRAAGQPWQTRWTGEVKSMSPGTPDGIAGVPDGSVQFAAVTDPLWRVRVLRGAESLGGARPSLRLGYHPARLRFLAQGEPPYTVAFGSARVPPAETISCGGLLPVAGAEDLIGAAHVATAPAGAFGGAEVLAPPPKPTPVRQIVLWVVLLLGTAALVAMAVSLLRRLREPDSPR